MEASQEERGQREWVGRQQFDSRLHQQARLSGQAGSSRASTQLASEPATRPGAFLPRGRVFLFDLFNRFKGDLRRLLSPVDHRSTDCGVSAKWPMDLCQSIHNSYFHAMRAQNYICIFSHYSSNIDPKSTENPATWRAARMHDFGISICCGQNHSQKKHRIYGVLSFALTPRSGGLGIEIVS